MNPRTILLAGAFSIALTGTAAAVDAPMAMPGVVYNWTGLYVGVHAGGGWGDKDWIFVASGLPTSHDVDGFLGGGQIGYNFQVDSWVLGIEGQLSWADIDGSSLCPNPLFTCRTEINWVGTLTGRVGIVLDNMLVYVRAGGAWADEDYTAFGPTVFSASSTRSGWTGGLGLEWAFTEFWSAKIDYYYIDFGTDRVNLVNEVGTTDPADVEQTLHIVKVGINYRFGGGAMPY